MSKRRKPAAPVPGIVETAIRTAGSIGALERLAGIGADHDSRAAFWRPYSRLPGATGLDAGVVELRRQIIANGLNDRIVIFCEARAEWAAGLGSTEHAEYWSGLAAAARRQIAIPAAQAA